ncbi:ATP-dependent 6-phosphofructokinase [Actinomycetospora endophytica]|uniref:ATP-dependent 6-phosphofructokinase n=1 Tax=Actinomycetospora endophytica TaxID=2291215 RepID=A0ABS8P640_9PSEU|nr:ATP-dependent 6-phosphofructokinase [Actinomycetospora endophytica]MCD2193727.1 ATP-dependent 6-phosphofructokinase [Actinomycetospora endophytica]
MPSSPTPARTDCEITTLGPCSVESPLAPVFEAFEQGGPVGHVDPDDRVLLEDTEWAVAGRDPAAGPPPSFEPARARRQIYFDPAATTAAIVTCGGLCPGLNDVIRGLVQQLRRQYGVERILGIRHGYLGLTRAYRDDAVELSGSMVQEIHQAGGTFLGTSRDRQDPSEMVDALEHLGIDVLFVIGGDGTMTGAREIVGEIERRDRDIAVVGLPKTIDNDLPFIDQSFGFLTAVTRAADTVHAAHAEALSVRHGVSVVKLMGRHAGFVACYAAIAVNDVDLVLIPEVPFAWTGENGLLAAVRDCVDRRGRALVVVAEGAGPEHRAEGEDIGPLVRDRVTADLTAHGYSPVMRYLDPSYAIRSVRADTYDSVYCVLLAHAAVHAAMSGRTGAVVARWRGRYVLVPMTLMTEVPHRVDPAGELWASVLEATRQPTRLDEHGIRIDTHHGGWNDRR